MNEDTLNGYGQRLNKVENKQAAQGVQIGTNEKQIDKIWLGFGEMQRSINGIMMKIFFMISPIIIMMGIQLILRFNGK